MAEEKRGVDDLYKKYSEKLKEKLGEDLGGSSPISSREYTQFKETYAKKPMSFYEKACTISEKFLKLKPDKKKEKELRESIDIAHLNITPSGATSFSIVFPTLILIVGILISMVVISTTPAPEEGLHPGFFLVFTFTLGSLILIFPFQKLPEFLANSWRMRASNQMVICIFYMVTYMRHTSNLELAIRFAAEHLADPLAADLKKVLWNVETSKFESVKESLDNYLETWRKWNMEFIESTHLIESSLYEASEERRLNSLDKALTTILDQTYEKMLHYAHNLKSPITVLHMIGIIMPILGLVILPLLVNFVSGVQWYHIAVLYNLILPIIVFYMGKVILSKRPTGYGDVDISEENPELKKYRNVIINLSGFELKITPLFFSVLIGVILFMIGISPVILHTLNPGAEKITLPFLEEQTIMEYRCPEGASCNVGEKVGPFGLGAAIISLFITMSFGIGIGLYYKLRSQNIIKLRERAKKLEEEIAASIFQLGNRIGDGIPVEIAFGKVSEVMEGSYSGNFFRAVSENIRKMGMGVEQAIFDPKYGALVHYPSKVIESTMKVLIESAKKGPSVAAQALLNISKYIKEIHKVDERLKDLMADVISSMKSQISFLTPVISGIVIGITSMITRVLTELSNQATAIMAGDVGGAGMGGITDMFGQGIPTYYFQIIVGLYVVQLIYLLTMLVNSIEFGEDKLNERYLLGVNLVKGTMLYCFISLVIMVIFNFVAGIVIQATATGV